MSPEELFGLLETTANMMRGMTLDPAIPAHAKAALAVRIAELDHAAGGQIQVTAFTEQHAEDLARAWYADDDVDGEDLIEATVKKFCEVNGLSTVATD